MNFSLCENRFNSDSSDSFRFDSDSSDSLVAMKSFATPYLVPTSPPSSSTILPIKNR